MKVKAHEVAGLERVFQVAAHASRQRVARGAASDARQKCLTSGMASAQSSIMAHITIW
jgi:hypothetical protein